MQLNVILHTVKFYLAALEGLISLLISYGLWCYKVIIICGVHYRQFAWEIHFHWEN